MILQKDIFNLNDMDIGVEARLDIIKAVEKNLNVFIYDHDLELLVQNPRAFDSFILAVAGQNKINEQNQKLPDWVRPQEVAFIAPKFS